MQPPHTAAIDQRWDQLKTLCKTSTRHPERKKSMHAEPRVQLCLTPLLTAYYANKANVKFIFRYSVPTCSFANAVTDPVAVMAPITAAK